MNGVAGADRWAGRVLAVTSAVLLAGSLRPTRRVRTTAALTNGAWVAACAAQGMARGRTMSPWGRALVVGTAAFDAAAGVLQLRHARAGRADGDRRS